MKPAFLSTKIRRFSNENRGAVAVEFALVVPVLLALYLGSVELTRYIILDQKVQRTASVVADLVTQNKSVSKSMLQGIFNIGAAMIEPYDVKPLRIRVSGIQERYDADRKTPQDPQVVWSQSSDGRGVPTQKELADIYDFKNGQTNFYVVVETNYTHSPITQYILTGPIEISAAAILRGRRSDTVPCSDCSSGSGTPTS